MPHISYQEQHSIVAELEIRVHTFQYAVKYKNLHLNLNEELAALTSRMETVLDSIVLHCDELGVESISLMGNMQKELRDSLPNLDESKRDKVPKLLECINRRIQLIQASDTSYDSKALDTSITLIGALLEALRSPDIISMLATLLSG